MRTILFLVMLGYSVLSVKAQSEIMRESGGDSVSILQHALDVCRKENERLVKLLPDSLRNPATKEKRPLSFRANNITWREEQKQISMYQVITDLDTQTVHTRVIAFLNRRGYIPEGTDTLKIQTMVLPELHPVKVRAWWRIEQYEPGFSVLKAWFRMPDGSYLNPDNYPGYHQKIQELLKSIIHVTE